MPIRIDGTNATANPGITGDDADTGFVFGTDQIEAVTGGTTRFTVESNGNVTVENGNLVLASGSGIDFSATANSSGTMSSELLDDYEEGTFTPVIETSGAVHTYTTQEGHYTKIGDMVYMSLRLDIATQTNTGGTSVFRMGQLPFASAAEARFVVTTYGVNFDATAYSIVGYLSSNDQVRILYIYDNNIWVAAKGNDFVFSAGDVIVVAGWYKIQ